MLIVNFCDLCRCFLNSFILKILRMEIGKKVSKTKQCPSAHASCAFQQRNSHSPDCPRNPPLRPIVSESHLARGWTGKGEQGCIRQLKTVIKILFLKWSMWLRKAARRYDGSKGWKNLVKIHRNPLRLRNESGLDINRRLMSLNLFLSS